MDVKEKFILVHVCPFDVTVVHVLEGDGEVQM